MPKQCTTCHFACACREERFKALIYAAMNHHHMPEEWRKEAVDLIYGGRPTPAHPPTQQSTEQAGESFGSSCASFRRKA
jgi:hypothetical protein